MVLSLMSVLSLSGAAAAPLEWRPERGDVHQPAPPGAPAAIRRPLYRRLGLGHGLGHGLGPLGALGALGYPRGLRPRLLRQDAVNQHKTVYPAPAPSPASTPAPTSDVHVVATSVSTSVKKVADEDVSGEPVQQQLDDELASAPAPEPGSEPGSASSVIHTVLVPPSGGLPVRFRPDQWDGLHQHHQQHQQHQQHHVHTEQAPQPAPPPAPQVYGVPEENYEVDEALSVLTNGRAHGRQPQPQQPQQADQANGGATSGTGQASSQPPPPSTSPPLTTPPPATSTTESTETSSGEPQQGQQGQQGQQQDGKPSGYVVEGRNYRKYRVEEKTPDGFIVGEYGVVSHTDGSLRGVRYTADSTINPRLIYDALVKFLSL